MVEAALHLGNTRRSEFRYDGRPVMSIPRPRPLLRIYCSLPPQQVVDRFRAATQERSAPVRGTFLTNHGNFFIDEEQRHFWSPWILVDIRPHEEGSIVEGRFGPHPHLWMAFIGLHLAVTFAIIVTGSWGAAQWIMGEPPWVFLGVPASVALGAFIVGAEFIGKGLGAEQVWLMRRFLADSCGGVHHDEKPQDGSKSG